MLGHRDLTIHDYAGILKRRLWLVLLCTLAFLGIGIGITYEIPPQYVSQTLVLIEQQKVPTDYVTPVLTEDLNERLASLREQILSRSRLEPIIQRFNLFAGSGVNMDDRVAATQKAIDVKPINGGPRGMPGFYITFKAPDARTAQQVCSEITSLFVSENLNAREESAEGTTEFLKQQLADAKTNLDEQDAKLADFERKYIGRLPDQEQSNEGTLQALTTQLDAATQSLDRLQENETFIEANITAQAHDPRDSGPGAVITPDDRNKQLRELEEQKKALDALYTPDHPDVQAINRKIAELQGEIAHSPSSSTASGKTASPSAPSDSPQIQQEKAQLRAVQQAIAAAKEEQDRIKRQIQTYEGRIDSSPLVEQEYKQVTRDHDIASQFYDSLLKKMDESSMATALEHRQEGEQFRVMDPPNLPDAPAFPNRTKFAGAGLAGGLGLGLLLAALLEYRDTTLRTELDVWAFTKLPTLAILSHIDGLPKSAKDQDGKSIAPTEIPAESVGG
ncbi:MAG: Wzz/FepE/Etk N-terminal domain-containing protein [Terracidiphilus sp.]|jgi:polysaccharide chain length determinant protein (PEP-CTERM system associated)